MKFFLQLPLSLLLLASNLPVRAEEPLVLTADSSAFTLDTRLPPNVIGADRLILRSESATFTLETQLGLESMAVGHVTKAESPAFTLDTRLPADTGVGSNLVTLMESAPFVLDSRLRTENPLLALLVNQAESQQFWLDTRMAQQDALYTKLEITAEYSPFTIDTVNGQVQAPAQTLTGATTGGKARFSQDGLRLAKAEGGQVLMWNLQSSRTNSVFVGHWGQVSSLDFSPLGDQLLTGSADGTFRWWDTASRLELGRTFPPGVGTVYTSYASDGARVVVGCGGNVSLYRASTMELLQEFSDSEGTVTAVALATEGLALAGNSARSAAVWDTATGNLLYRLNKHQGMITAVAFFPGGSNAMTASLDGTIRVWEMATGTQALCIPVGAPVADANLSLDGRLIASCDTGNPGTAYLWDAPSGGLMRVFKDASWDASQIKAVALSPDQTVLATTHVDGRVRLWNTGFEPRPIYPVTTLTIGGSALFTLRSHGLYYFEVDAEARGSLVVTLEADPGAAVGTTLNRKSRIPAGFARGLSADAEFANLGTPQADKNVGAPESKSLQRPPPGADITAFRMTATKGHLPSMYDYETFSQAPVNNLHCEMPILLTSAGKAYVLAFAPFLSAGSIQARIHAEYSDFVLSDISPARGGNSGNVTARLQGTGLTPDTTARLIGPGGATVSSQLAMWGDSSKVWFTFALSNAPVGSYQVEISKPGATSTLLAYPFQVVAAPGLPPDLVHTTRPLLRSSLTAPSAVRSGRDYSMTLAYANVGDIDIAAPLFVVSAGDQKPSIYRPPSGNLSIPGPSQTVVRTFTTPQVPQVQILGLNQDGPPGILPPGANWEIPIYFQANSGSDATVQQPFHLMTFLLSVLNADATPIDWTALESRFQPTNIPPDLWAAVWTNFKTTVGTTWADYLRALDTQAHLLALANQPSYSASDLLTALFSQAVGAPYRRTLAVAVDAQAPVPALPLQFSRFATDGLEHRFTLGALGRGWSHNYEYTLTQPTDGVVIIRTPGAGGRRFTLGADSVWHGETGDYAALTSIAGGAFVLVEKQGISWQFDGNGKLAFMAETNGNRITLTYSGSALTALAHSAGPTFMLEYNAQGRISRLTDHAGQVTTYEYDSAGEHLVRVTAPGNVTNTYAYQPFSGSPSDHALTSVTFPDGTHQFFSWDAQGRVAEQSRDGGAERLQFAYTADGTFMMRDTQDAVTALRLGARGQLLQMTDALGHPVTINYDTNFNFTRLTGPVGDTTELTYDAQGNAVSIVNPLGQQVTLTCAPLGRLSNLRDARGQPTDFSYDPQGNLTGIAYADASAETFGYDTSGSVTTWQNRRGQPIQFTRSAQGQLNRKTYPDGRTIDYLYDARGQLTNIVDTAGAPTFLSATNSLSYDARGFLTSITYPDGKGFTFDYNAAGRRTRRVGHDGYTLNYSYDSAGRLASLTEGTTNELVRYAYDPAGRLIRENKGNGTFTTYTYDLAGQLIALTNHASLLTVNSFFNYSYDAKGNRLTMTTTVGVTAYEYDALNQLTGVTYPGGRHVTYAYDPAGNRTVVSDNGRNSVYAANSLNQYTQAGEATFGYDTDGNMNRRTDTTGTTTYEYDSENRLVRVVTPTNGVFQHTYDALGNRTAVTHDGVTNRYLHDPIGLVGVAAEYDATGSLVARYDHALGLVSRADSDGNAAFYSFDALGNTREVTGPSGAVLNAYDYDAFGATSAASEIVPNAFQLVGRFGVVQEQSGTHFMRARYFSQGIFPLTKVGLSLQILSVCCRQNPISIATS